MADPTPTPTPAPTPAPQNFWQKNQVILTGIAMSIIISLQQFLGQPTVDWAVVGFAALLGVSSWAANNLRGKGVSVLGLIGVAGYAITSVAVNGTINLNQLILAFIVGLGALVAPPPKPASYEQSSVIVAAKAEAKTIDTEAAKKT
jgi:hypothetical protein